jgi:hypothetical protein
MAGPRQGPIEKKAQRLIVFRQQNSRQDPALSRPRNRPRPVRASAPSPLKLAIR